MSDSIRRKSLSKQLLQNLIRVTAQRSQEDAEEAERERRRRSREKERGEGSPSLSELPQHNYLIHSTELDEDLQPSYCLVPDEDEGFSDWSHRLENRNEQEVPEDCGATVQRPSTPQWKMETEVKKQREDEEEGSEPEQGSWFMEDSKSRPDKMPSNTKEAGTSYSSMVFLPQDTRLQQAVGQPADRTSYLVTRTVKPCGGAGRVDGQVEQEEPKEEENLQAALQTEWRSAESRQSPKDEGVKEDEKWSFTHKKTGGCLLRREERHREEDDEEGEEGEDHKMSDKRSQESRSSEEATRRCTSSLCSSIKGKESLTCYGPMSPTFKKLLIQFYPDEVSRRVSTDGKCTITERTESLRKGTNTIKKMLLPVSKIDKKLEEYTHALEVSSKESRSGSQVLTDLTAAEPVSSKKNLFEVGEAWNQNAVSVTPSKDADSLKVGVADLINQWVRGSEDGIFCSSPPKPSDSSGVKRHRFVVTGHGKYEKVSTDDSCEDTNCHSAQQFYEDL